jgi:hypothetical protein
MNLLKRLKPEVLQAMNADAEQYPNLIASLKKALEAEIGSPLNLSVNDASYICHYNNKNLDIINLLGCFNTIKKSCQLS